MLADGILLRILFLTYVSIYSFEDAEFLITGMISRDDYLDWDLILEENIFFNEKEKNLLTALTLLNCERVLFAITQNQFPQF